MKSQLRRRLFKGGVLAGTALFSLATAVDYGDERVNVFYEHFFGKVCGLCGTSVCIWHLGLFYDFVLCLLLKFLFSYFYVFSACMSL